MRGRVVVAVVMLFAAACSSGDDAADQLAVDDGDGAPSTTSSEALTPLTDSDDVSGAGDEIVTADDPAPDESDAPTTEPDTAEPEDQVGEQDAPASDESTDDSASTGSGGGDGTGGGGDDEPTDAANDVSEPPATEPPEPDASVPTATTPPAGTTVSGEVEAFFPDAQIELVQGGEVWAVVLAGANAPDDAALRDAELAAEDAGYRTGPTDCDVGAPEALGLAAGGVFTVSVYFATESDARSAAAAFADRGTSGEVALVQTFCLD